MRKFLLLLLTGFALNAFAETESTKKITGAFGLTLGEKFTSELTVNGPGSGATFTPKDPLKGYDFYKVLVTPSTHLIWGIMAVRKVSGPDAAYAEIKRISKITGEKYGLSLSDSSEDYAMFDDGAGHSIRIFRQDFKVVIMYEDAKLSRQAKQEQAALINTGTSNDDANAQKLNL